MVNVIVGLSAAFGMVFVLFGLIVNVARAQAYFAGVSTESPISHRKATYIGLLGCALLILAVAL